MITSATNDRIKRLTQLNQRAKLRREEGVFLVEGRKMFLEAPSERVEEVYVSEAFLKRCIYDEDPEGRYAECVEALGRIGYEVVADSLFEKISDTCTPQGILCVVKQRQWKPEELLDVPDGSPLLLVLENIQDPGNLGTMLRTAEGAGASGIILSRDSADLYNPKTIRATMGSIYRMPVYLSENLVSSIVALKAAGVHIYAAHLMGGQTHTQPDYRDGAAFLIGNEGNGLTERTAETADTLIRIPMEGQVESLNAAVAAAVLLYEAQRQRNA